MHQVEDLKTAIDFMMNRDSGAESKVKNKMMFAVDFIGKVGEPRRKCLITALEEDTPLILRTLEISADLQDMRSLKEENVVSCKRLESLKLKMLPKRRNMSDTKGSKR
ncbi:hypothetical protein AAG570_002815 [Ranatra chinensis]|uniref:Uncharacterized protein n=1 Tax=Ranatra chinensis TaxID=642074 RepID=A0ABD0Y641_9HEMI